MKLKTFNYSLSRAVKPRAYWASESEPSYKPYWMVALASPISKDTVQSGAKWCGEAAKICPDCLAVPKGVSPAAAYPCKDKKHDCQKALRRFLDKYMAELNKAHLQAVQRNELERVRSALSFTRVNERLVWDVVKVYLQRSSKESAKENATCLRAMLEERFGVKAEAVRFEQICGSDWVIDWCEMRQEYNRRGWSVRGAAPKDAWDVLRGMMASKRLPGLDTRTPVAGNTTIQGYLRKAAAIFGASSRSVVLRGEEVPEMAWLDLKLSLPRPEGYRGIEDSKYEEMMAELPILKREDLKVWVWVRFLLAFGMRPIELEAVKWSWIEQRGDMHVLVLKNRPEEGFILKAGDRAAGAVYEVPKDLVAVIMELQRDASEDALIFGSIFAVEFKTQVAKINRRASQWLRQFLGDASMQTNYLLRHNRAAIAYTVEGVDAAGKALGHASGSAITLRKYAKNLDVVPALDDTVLRSRGKKVG